MLLWVELAAFAFRPLAKVEDLNVQESTARLHLRECSQKGNPEADAKRQATEKIICQLRCVLLTDGGK